MKPIEIKNLEALFLEAEKLRNSGNFLNAIQVFKNILKVKPDSIPILNGLANCYFQLNKLDIAEDYYLQCLKNDTSNVQILNNLALLYLRNKNYEKAKQILQKSLLINIDQENIVEKIGFCLIQTKLYSEASEFCEKFLKKYPENKFLLSYYEKSLFKIGKNIDGLKLLQKQTGFIQFDDDKVKII
tara:strand:- start:60 stop:617 length:558 start_codon:yes stop_codon:yes gene_type:complete